MRLRPLVRAVFAVALASASSACSAHSQVATSTMAKAVVPQPAQASRHTHADDLNAARRDEERAERAVVEALGRVAALRELAPTSAVHAKVIGRAQMVAEVRSELRRDVPEEVVRATGKMLFAFGVVGPNFDFERSLLDLMTAELAGFYEPVAKTMYLSGDLGGAEREATLSHELVHALQDQHYDLAKLIAYRPDASDEQSALHALAEGDATSAMLDAMLAPRGLRAIDLSDELVALQAQTSFESNPETSAVPAVIRRSILASYTDGLPFVHWARRQGGWAAIDEIWQRPPVSTEQLLHPDKYLRHESPLSVPVPAAPPNEPNRVAYTDVEGEQSLRILLEEWVPHKIAVASAAGWGGDRLAVFGDELRTAVAWHIRYDDSASGLRGFSALARGVVKDDPPRPRAPTELNAAEFAVRSGQVCRERAQRGPFAAVRHGREVALVAGPIVDIGGESRSAGDCRSALRWAQVVVSQR